MSTSFYQAQMRQQGMFPSVAPGSMSHLGTEDGPAAALVDYILEHDLEDERRMNKVAPQREPMHQPVDVWAELAAVHTLLIRGIPRDISLATLERVLSSYGQYFSLMTSALREEGCVRVTYYDHREAENALRLLSSDQNFGVRLHVLPFPLVESADSDSGVGIIEVWGLNGIDDFDIVQFCSQFGPVRATIRRSNSYVVEYFDLRDARRARERLPSRSIGDTFGPVRCSFVSGHRSWLAAGIPSRYDAGMPQQPPMIQFAPSSQQHQQQMASAAALYGMSSSSSTAMAGNAMENMPPSPTTGAPWAMQQRQAPQQQQQQQQGSGAPPPLLNVMVNGPAFPTQNSNAMSLHQPPQRYLNPSAGRPSMPPPQGAPRAAPNGPSPAPQSRTNDSTCPIDIDAIRGGHDLRTTLMVRNIPNKYTQDMLLEALNKTHYRKYDFVYLPIDFTNHCNVGYAFVNVMNPMDIISFVENFAGKKWERFNSDKICVLNYARIQGKDHLVRHFKHSNIMHEQKKYRPKIFFSEGERSGLEEPFPESDDEMDSFSDKLSRMVAVSKKTPMQPLQQRQQQMPMYRPAY